MAVRSRRSRPSSRVTDRKVLAIVLVGGFGTRLRPLTLEQPKQMLPLGPLTMLERVVGRLGSQGIDTAVLSLGYQPDAFMDAFPGGVCAGVRLQYAVEPEPLDTAGAIAFAARHVGVDETFVAVNGDVLSLIDVVSLIDSHRSFGGDATIALTSVDDPSRFGVVPLHSDGRVIEFVEKPDPGSAPSSWINAGTYVLEPSVLDRIPEGRKVSIERETFPALVDDGVLFGVQSTGYWIDAGTPEAYLQVHLDLIDGRCGPAEDLVDVAAIIDPTAAVTRSSIGARAEIGAGCRIVDSVIMDDVVVGDGSVVERSILASGSMVAPGSGLGGLTVVGYGQRIDDRVDVEGGVFPPPDEWNV